MSEYFTEDTFVFLRSLGENNNRDWFNEHKAEYEQYVREPALAFIRAMRPELARFAPHFVAADKKVGGSLMRVYRDVRFGKNKQPYKTNIGMQFRHEIGKDVHAPGFYLHIEAGEVFVGAGIWHPDSDTLKKIRSYIDAHPTRWLDAMNNTAFKKAFQMGGDSLKRAPKGYPMDHPMIEALKRKDFIAIGPLMPELILEDDLVGFIASYFETAQPLMQQLCRALGCKF
ncbi:MAG: TIGR02453 family protein [Proteobacteria bacterium]|nr:MAG: TIGR02453 family protein [Pseudomonadota bacterium]